MGISPNLPLSSFDPRYREILLRGSREAFSIECKDKDQAHQLQSILCTFRSRMRKHHADTDRAQWEPLYGCIVGKDGRFVKLRPRHAQFESVLSDFGTAPKGAAQNLASPSKPEGLVEGGDDLLASLLEEQESKPPELE